MIHEIKDLSGGNKGTESLIINTGDEIVIYATDKQGFEQPVCGVEIWKGKLRVLAWPDAEDADSGPIVTEIRNLS